MKRLGGTLLAAALGAWAASPARAQVFAGVPGLEEQLSAIRAQAGLTAASLAQPPAVIAQAQAAQAPDVSGYAVRGMDISHYQDAVDWDQVKTQNLSFVYVKATDGADIQDERFQANWRGATRIGLLKGAYHFYDFCQKGLAQAENFIREVPREPGALPPAIDLEMSHECRKMPAKAAFLKEFKAFVAAVEKHYQVQPVLYIEASIYAKYMKGTAEPYYLGYSDPDHTAPETPDGRPWKLWQYTFRGRVAGINGPVDLDVFNGTKQDLSQLGSAGERQTMVASR